MCKVLVLDDDPYFCQRTAKILAQAREDRPYHVSTFEDAAAAVHAAHQAVAAGEPFEIFVIDQRLGFGVDGIEVLRELLLVSPDSDGIILTAYDKLEDDGARAYEAGAFRYLLKNAERELRFVLQSLRYWRQVQSEHNWQQTQIRMSEDALRCNHFHEAAQIVVKYALELDNENAFLFWVPQAEDANDPDCLIGVAQDGSHALWNGQSQSFHLRNLSPFSEALQKTHTSFYRSFGQDTHDPRLVALGHTLAGKDWAVVPLWSANTLLGMLVTVHDPQKRAPREIDRAQTDLFAQQAAAVLERARLFEREQRSLEETQTINKIGRHINARAAADDLTSLLDEARTHIGALMNVDNFIVFLVDDANQQLDFRLQYERGQKMRPRMLSLDRGMAAHLLEHRDPLLLKTGVREYREQRRIPLYGKQAQCWLGVPLLIEDRAIGGLIVQDYDRPYSYTDRDARLLSSIAAQVAGAIQISRLAEAEREEAQRLQILQRASIEMMRIANENEDHFWLTLLTLATASFGTRFNRALLFLTDQGDRLLVGRMGIGTEDDREARRDWRADERRGFDFDRFLQEVAAGDVKPTPFEDRVKELEIDLETDGRAFAEVLENHHLVRVPAAQVASRLPEQFNRQFSFSECAVLPLMAGKQARGVLVVDNKHDGKAIQTKMLERLQTLMNSAGLVWESLQQRRLRDFLLETNQAILGKSVRLPLAHTLQQICDAARKIIGADWAIIYPLKQGAGNYEFDTPNISYAGQLKQPLEKVIKDKPRQSSVSTYILRNELMIVRDVKNEKPPAGRERLADHKFIAREGIQAMIGIAIRDEMTSESLGVFYLDFRSPRDFSWTEINQAMSFAGLAAVAISTAWRIDAARQSGEVLGQRERELIRQILESALAGNTEEKVVATVVLKIDQALNLFGAKTALILRAWESASLQVEPREVYKQYTLSPEGQVIAGNLPEVDRKTMRAAIRTKKTIRLGSRQAYLPVGMRNQVVGVLFISHPEDDLSPAHIEILERFAPVVALALDNIRRQEHLHSVLQVAQKVTEPTDLDHSFLALLASARRVSPDLSALTLWYRDDEEHIALGQTFGLQRARRVKPHPEGLEPPAVIDKVMGIRDPVFAEAIHDESEYFGAFPRVVSGAAFPLRADNEVVGAMFFYYRRRHLFSYEERTLFTLLAEIVAASIRDARRLEDEHNERVRLQAALKTGKTIGTVLDLKEILVRVLQHLSDVFHDTSLCVMTYDEDERVLRFAPETLPFYPIDNPEYLTRHTFPIDGPSIACQVARRALAGEPLAYQNVEQVDDYPAYLPLISDSCSELCMSLTSQERLMGVLVLERKEPRGFNENDVKLVQGIAHQIAMAMQRAEQSSRLQFKSNVAATYAWTADMAHDINREMGHIKGWTYLIREMAGDPDRVSDYAGRIEKSARYLMSVNTYQSPDTEWIYLDELLRQSVAEFAGARNILIDFDLHCENLKVKLNRVALRRVLRHLVRNAAESMVAQPEKRLHVFTQRSGEEHVEIRLSDSGPGVGAAIAPFVFQKPVTTKDKNGGYGLLMVRQMVEDMEGRIRLLPPEPGSGAVFSIRLPIQPPENGGAASPDGSGSDPVHYKEVGNDGRHTA